MCHIRLFNLLSLQRTCIICNISPATRFYLCDFCYSILPWVKPSNFRCNKCLTVITTKEQQLCTSCQTEPKFFTRIQAIFSYLPPIKNMLFALKFQHKLMYAKFFGNILLANIRAQLELAYNLTEAVIPVPLHITKLRSRGFNQALELAKYLSPLFKIDNTVCSKTKSTISQTKLSKSQRKRNIANTFYIKKFNYKNIIILDDVVTTGSTVNSLAAAIKAVNPTVNIDVWAVARS